MHDVLLVIHLLLAIGLVATILVQRSDGEGFGTGGGGNAFMTGRASANLLTRTTAILATLFMLTSLGLTLINRKSERSIVDTIHTEAPAAAPAATPEQKPADTNSVPVAQ